MTTLLTILKGIGVLIVGLTLRLAVAVLVVAALLVPGLVLYFGVNWLLQYRRRRLGLADVSGLPWRSGLLHTKEHLWLKAVGDEFRIGIDGVAQKLLPGVTRVALPMPGARLRRGEPIAEVVTATRRVAIPAPMDGTVALVNGVLGDQPSKLTRDPYLGGWLLTLRSATVDRGACLEGEPARRWFASEGRRLARMMEQEMGMAAADGGSLLTPPERTLTDEEWERITNAFLKAA